MLWWCLKVVVVGPEACFEWLGSCSKLKRGPLAVHRCFVVTNLGTSDCGVRAWV